MPFSQEMRDIIAKHEMKNEILGCNLKPGDPVIREGRLWIVVDVRIAPESVQKHTDWTHGIVIRSTDNVYRGVASYIPETGEVGKFAIKQNPVNEWMVSCIQ